MRARLGALAALAALAAAGPASPQDGAPSYEDSVRAYLDAGAEPHAARGHRPVRNSETVQGLTLDGAMIVPLNVRRGETYVVYGACDDDCRDLDMEIYGPDGMLAERDILPDDTPFVQLTAAASGRAYVRVWLASCAAEPCYVGVRAMSGGEVVSREPAASMFGVEAPADWPQRVRALLTRSGERHLDARYTVIARSEEEEIAPVRSESDGHRVAYELEAGRTYRFQAACDQDCSDVDIEVLDPAGAQIALNVDFDNNPYVEVTPAASGSHVVRVWLAQCSVEPCYVGVQGYQR